MTSVPVHRSPSLLARFFGLVRGRLFGSLRAAEERHPRAVYERAIEARLRQYDDLRRAAAGVLYLRNRTDAEIAERRRELTTLVDEIQRTVRRGDDDAALALIGHRHAVEEDLERCRRERVRVGQEAEEAKQSLLRFRDEIRALERERVRSLSMLATASARRRLREAIDGTSLDADLRALDTVREHVAREASSREIDDELEADGVDARLRALRVARGDEAARRELAELRARLRPTETLIPPATPVPMELRNETVAVS